MRSLTAPARAVRDIARRHRLAPGESPGGQDPETAVQVGAVKSGPALEPAGRRKEALPRMACSMPDREEYGRTPDGQPWPGGPGGTKVYTPSEDIKSPRRALLARTQTRPGENNARRFAIRFHAAGGFPPSERRSLPVNFCSQTRKLRFYNGLRGFAHYEFAWESCTHAECRRRQRCTGGPRGTFRRFGAPLCRKGERWAAWRDKIANLGSEFSGERAGA